MKKEILYQEIARTIACQIKKGVWKAGEKLPSLRTISNENGVSLNTAIQAYYELEKDGFIISRPKSHPVRRRNYLIKSSDCPNKGFLWKTPLSTGFYNPHDPKPAYMRLPMAKASYCQTEW